MAEIKVGSRVVTRDNRVGVVTEIRIGEEPAPPMAIFKPDVGQPEFLALNVLQTAEDYAAMPGSPVAAVYAELKEARARITELENELATLRASIRPASP